MLFTDMTIGALVTYEGRHGYLILDLSYRWDPIIFMGRCTVGLSHGVKETTDTIEALWPSSNDAPDFKTIQLEAHQPYYGGNASRSQPGWVCPAPGCREKLTAAEKVCWKCGGKRQ